MLRLAVLRWHPVRLLLAILVFVIAAQNQRISLLISMQDKFQQQFGPQLRDSESERILERVNTIASSLNRLRKLRVS